MGVRVDPLHYGDKQSDSSSATQSEQQEPFDIDFTVLSYDVGFEKHLR